MLIDSHAHLDLSAYGEDLPAVLDRCREAGVEHIVNIVSPLEMDRLAELRARAAEAGIGITLSAGIHPHDASHWSDALEERLEALVTESCQAWGEIGLDYHYDNSPRDEQRRVFRRQIALARRHGKPIVVHSREADQDTVAILEEEGASEVGGVIHCFTGSPALAEGALGLGFHLSFSGILTFRNAEEIREVARRAPSDRILVETDCPYLAPIPHRGKRNEPAWVRFVADRLAEERETTLPELAEQTRTNTRRLFGIV